MKMNLVIVNNIKKTLKELELEKEIKILFAIESGSRGWGFPSPDSDYDCRFVYIKLMKQYLKLDLGADYIDLPVDETYDVNGWDLKKLLIHIRKSNPVMWEWLQSPIFYEEIEGVRLDCLKLANLYFDEKAGLYHYRSLARKKLESIQNEAESKLKHYFYALRSTMCCHYIRTHHEIPPMEMSKLIEGLELPCDLKEEVQRLLDIKLQVDEKYTIPQNHMIINYIEDQLTQCEVYAETLQKKKSITSEPLDQYFRDWVVR